MYSREGMGWNDQAYSTVEHKSIGAGKAGSGYHEHTYLPEPADIAGHPAGYPLIYVRYQ